MRCALESSLASLGSTNTRVRLMGVPPDNGSSFAALRIPFESAFAASRSRVELDDAALGHPEVKLMLDACAILGAVLRRAVAVEQPKPDQSSRGELLAREPGALAPCRVLSGAGLGDAARGGGLDAEFGVEQEQLHPAVELSFLVVGGGGVQLVTRLVQREIFAAAMARQPKRHARVFGEWDADESHVFSDQLAARLGAGDAIDRQQARALKPAHRLRARGLLGEVGQGLQHLRVFMISPALGVRSTRRVLREPGVYVLLE
jgi:hypothetical protein